MSAQIGISLDCDIKYQHASLRFFEKGERHVTRFCRSDVLLLVYEGVLRFSEAGEQIEVAAGEYHIQHRDTHQGGELVSDSPKYLYVHFLGEWADNGNILPRHGSFNVRALYPTMKELDTLAHGEHSYVEHAAVFFKILASLSEKRKGVGLASDIAEYLDAQYLSGVTLDALCKKFHYSKNHIVNIFKAEYGRTPVEYVNDLKLKRAMYLLEVTSRSAEEIAEASGFNYYSHFYRLFLKKTDLSPTEWRKQRQMR